VTLAAGVELRAVDITRNFYMTSACGSLDAVRLASMYIPRDDACTVAATTLATMPAQLRSARKVCSKSTGGLHGAALLRTDGQLLGGARGRRLP
jgi:FdhD protein